MLHIKTVVNFESKWVVEGDMEGDFHGGYVLLFHLNGCHIL